MSKPKTTIHRHTDARGPTSFKSVPASKGSGWSARYVPVTPKRTPTKK